MIKKKEEKEEKQGKIEIDLTGPDGNAFYILAQASQYAGQLNLDEKKIFDEMRSSDYENLIQVFDNYFGEYVDLLR